MKINGNRTIKKFLTLEYGNFEIKQHNNITYLECIFGNNVSGESMAAKIIHYICCKKPGFLSL